MRCGKLVRESLRWNLWEEMNEPVDKPMDEAVKGKGKEGLASIIALCHDIF